VFQNNHFFDPSLLKVSIDQFSRNLDISNQQSAINNELLIARVARGRWFQNNLALFVIFKEAVGGGSISFRSIVHGGK